MTNYTCTSRCAHCLYGCSPAWPKDYMDQDMLVRVLARVKGLGCHSVHIGGGEPFLDPEGLKMVVETTLARGVSIEYVETNSSWYKDPQSARELLDDLRGRGLGTLLVSMSPFHNEHIPFRKVKGVLDACRDTGMAIFPWIPEFYSEIDTFDDHVTHSLDEYEESYGKEYLREIPSRYWVHFGGLSDFAFREYGYEAGGRYMSKCDLCMDIRKYLVLEKGIDSPEFQPGEFYENV